MQSLEIPGYKAPSAMEVQVQLLQNINQSLFFVTKFSEAILRVLLEDLEPKARERLLKTLGLELKEVPEDYDFEGARDTNPGATSGSEEG